MSGSSAKESRGGVPLTNLDEPLFDGAGATKRDLVDYLDAVHDADPPGARGPAAVGDPRAPRPGSVHAEERAEVHARLGAHRRRVGGGLEAERPVRALQRPAHPALVREPAGHRVPPRARPRRRARPRHPPRARPRSAGCRRVRGGRRGRAPRPPRAGRHRAGRRGQDERRQRACTSSCRSWACSMPDAAAATRAISARAASLDPDDRDDRVHQGRPRGQGVRRSHPGRRRDRDRGLQPARPSRRARVVPRRAGTISTPSRRPTSRCTPRSACSAAATRGPTQMPDAASRSRGDHRGRPHDPRSPCAPRCTRASAGPAPAAPNAPR